MTTSFVDIGSSNLRFGSSTAATLATSTGASCIISGGPDGVTMEDIRVGSGGVDGIAVKGVRTAAGVAYASCVDGTGLNGVAGEGVRTAAGVAYASCVDGTGLNGVAVEGVRTALSTSGTEDGSTDLGIGTGIASTADGRSMASSPPLMYNPGFIPSNFR